ncbi:MAG: ankyrin repeat domain-containing protein [Gammaproteobacteria bacterium]|jgi:ankyrin repeat protein|nr:ankyrin repeat domain-containing protein [Gammaproteobacteria bacterium]
MNIFLDEKLDDAVNQAELISVKVLIDQGADIEAVDAFGCTPLMNAAWVASVDIVEYLISLGANVYAVNNEGKTALDMAESVGHNDYGHDAVIVVLTKEMKRRNRSGL